MSHKSPSFLELLQWVLRCELVMETSLKTEPVGQENIAWNTISKQKKNILITCMYFFFSYASK